MGGKVQLTKLEFYPFFSKMGKLVLIHGRIFCVENKSLFLPIFHH